MPIEYKKYPADWKQRRARILERAGNKCEFCSVPNGLHGWRDEISQFHELDEDWSPTGVKFIKIVLTIAHLDHDEENHEVQDTRLRALCQRCHLAYDKIERRDRKDKKRGQGTLV